MTVFLPRENIFFIEEWLKYHIAIGFTHFYLYNNMGSRWLDQNNNLEVTKMNKRGESIYGLLADKTDLEVQQDLDRILEPFKKKGYITQVSWQPRDESGNITYRQGPACIDYVNKYSMDSDWVAFTDMDEFIFPLHHDNIDQFIDNIENYGFTYVYLCQKCFASRFTKSNQPVKEVLGIYKCSDLIITKLATKAIVKANTLKHLAKDERFNIHIPSVCPEKSKFFFNTDIIRFNHYKFNETEVDRAKTIFNIDLGLNTIDKDIMLFYSRLRVPDL